MTNTWQNLPAMRDFLSPEIKNLSAPMEFGFKRLPLVFVNYFLLLICLLILTLIHKNFLHISLNLKFILFLFFFFFATPAKCQVKPFPNGKMTLNEDKIYFTMSCNFRYKLLGNSKIRCNHGQWSHPFPICIGERRKNNFPSFKKYSLNLLPLL